MKKVLEFVGKHENEIEMFVELGLVGLIALGLVMVGLYIRIVG